MPDYEEGIVVNKLMPINSPGIITGCDSIIISNNIGELEYKLNSISLSDQKTRERFSDINYEKERVHPITYRPLDKKIIYLDSKYIARSRDAVMKHFNRLNTGLAFSRGVDYRYKPVYVVDGFAEGHVASALTYIAPLWLYHDDGTKTPNFDPALLKELLSEMGPYCYTPERSDRETPPDDFWVTAIDVFDYIYGVLHSPKYRKKYKEFLKTDFPRIPKPKSAQQFAHYAVLGRELRDLHLMNSPDLDTYDTTYSIAGGNVVEKIEYSPIMSYIDKGTNSRFVGYVDKEESEELPYGNVYINDTQFFGNVPKLAWNFYIGGYQPAQKWLKDRKGHTLNSDDIMHYQKIIKVLVETDKIMKQIDVEHE